eukprot:869137_1
MSTFINIHHILIILLHLFINATSNAIYLPTPSVCFNNSCNFYSCCTEGLPGCNLTSCWTENRTEPTCCQSAGNTVEWEYCMDSPQYTLQKMEINPSPVIVGQNCTVTTDWYYNKTSTTATTGGNLLLTIYSPDINNCQMEQIGNVLYDLCDIVSSKCPIIPGTNFTSLFVVPDSIMPQNTSPG